MKRITGRIVRHPFEDGVYGIEDKEGNQYLPINLPNQLKVEGKQIKCLIQPADVVSYIMWGEPVELISFET